MQKAPVKVRSTIVLLIVFSLFTFACASQPVAEPAPEPAEKFPLEGADFSIMVDGSAIENENYRSELVGVLEEDFPFLIKERHKAKARIIEDRGEYAPGPENYLVMIELKNYVKGGVSKYLASKYTVVRNGRAIIEEDHDTETIFPFQRLTRRLEEDIMHDVIRHR